MRRYAKWLRKVAWWLTGRQCDVVFHVYVVLLRFHQWLDPMRGVALDWAECPDCGKPWPHEGLCSDDWEWTLEAKQ